MTEHTWGPQSDCKGPTSPGCADTAKGSRDVDPENLPNRRRACRTVPHARQTLAARSSSPLVRKSVSALVSSEVTSWRWLG